MSKELEKLVKDVAKAIENSPFSNHDFEVGLKYLRKKNPTEVEPYSIALIKKDCFTSLISVNETTSERCLKRFLFELEMLKDLL